jgi:hypothetical protein
MIETANVEEPNLPPPYLAAVNTCLQKEILILTPNITFIPNEFHLTSGTNSHYQNATSFGVIPLFVF